MGKNITDALYKMILRGLTVLFALFNEIGVVNIDKWDAFVDEMQKDDDAEEAE